MVVYRKLFNGNLFASNCVYFKLYMLISYVNFIVERAQF
jgi:hypothetical protein